MGTLQTFKLSTTAAAVCLVLFQFSSPVHSKALLSTEDTAQWDETAQAYYLPNTWASQNCNYDPVITVDLPEGSSFFLPKSGTVGVPFAHAYGKTASSPINQSVTINNSIKTFRWQNTSSSFKGVFYANRTNSVDNAVRQTVKLGNIDSLQLIVRNSSSIDANVFFEIDGSNLFNISQEFSGIDEQKPPRIGSISVIKSKTDETLVSDKGTVFYLNAYTTNTKAAGLSKTAVKQVFNGIIENIGSEAAPLKVGAVARFVNSTNCKGQFPGEQIINEIGNLYGTLGGIIFTSGNGAQKQVVNKVGKINIKAPDETYGVIAGVFNHSNIFADKVSTEGSGQYVGIAEEVRVSGQPVWTVNSLLSAMEKRNKFVAAIANFGGTQTISSLNDRGPVTLSAENTGGSKGFAVLLISALYSSMVNGFKAATVTELKGSFRVDGGDVAVVGHRMVSDRKKNTPADISKDSNWTKASDGGITLKLTPSEYGNKLILGKNSNLFVSPKTAAAGYVGSFLASYDSTTGLGVRDPKATEHFVLEAGTADKPYVVSFEEANSYAFVDGTLKGNAVFEFKAAMEKQTDGGYALNVNKNPIAIRNIEAGSSINFLVNYDVDKGNKEAVAQSPERSVNDFAHLYLQKADNARIVVKDVANHLIIGKDAAANLTKKDFAELVSYEKVNKINIEDNVLNAANANNTSATSDRTVRGTVTINVEEGILLPSQSYIGDFYLENSGSVGVVPEALKNINDDIRKALYGLDPYLTDPVEAAKQEQPQKAARSMLRARRVMSTVAMSNDVMPLADDDDKDKESVDTVLDSFGETVQAQTTSSEVLKVETVTAKDVPPQAPGVNPPADNPDNPSDIPTQGDNTGADQKPDQSTAPTVVPTPTRKTSTMAALESVGIANYFIWRQSTETMSQRMGEVRLAPELEGLWVRTIVGKNKYTHSGNYLSNKYYGITLGLDRNIGGAFGWTVGGAVEYIHGDGKLANSGKDKNWLGSVALYGTKQFENAGYFDLVFKASRMHNNFTAISDEYRYISKGAYHNYGYQLAAEYGKQFFLSDKWFVEPQAQLTYGRINSVTYKTDTGVTAKVKGINSLIGRVGVQAGYKSDKAEAFVRVDGLRDFTAKYKVNYSLGPVKNQSNVSLKDTWGEVAAGTTFKFGKSVKGYAQVKRSFAAKVKQEYRADVGLRLMF